jgi:hypothetical protein
MRAWALIAALFVGLAVAPAALAQTERPDCTAILDRALSDPEPNADLLEAARVCQEMAKVREEVADLERTNAAIGTSPFAPLLPWSTLITGLVGLVLGLAVPFVGMIFNRTLRMREDMKREQERFLALMEGVGSEERTKQLASTSALLRRYEELASKQKAGSSSDMKTIQDVFVAILRDESTANEDPNGAFQKYLADSLVRAFGVQDLSVRRPEPTEPATRRRPPPPGNFSFSDRDLQGAKLRGVFWAGVFAENVDFFQADMVEASLRDSWLKDCVFYEAKLERAVLRRADLRNANFMSATLMRADLRHAVLQNAKFDGADLSGARLQGADLTGATGLENARFDDKTAWDNATKWPDDRRPGAGYDLAAGPSVISA